MNAHHIATQSALTVTERRAPIALSREDSFFQGWGPRL
jgi:hypothetical protein